MEIDPIAKVKEVREALKDTREDLHYCWAWDKQLNCRCVWRVEKNENKYCKNHKHLEEEVTDEKHTPAKTERKIAIPGRAKSKIYKMDAVTKMKPKSLTDALEAVADIVDTTVEDTRSGWDVSFKSKKDEKKPTKEVMDLTEDSTPASTKPKKAPWAPKRVRQLNKKLVKNTWKDVEDLTEAMDKIDKEEEYKPTNPTFPPTASEIPDSPPEEHSDPKEPPEGLCSHKAASWSFQDRYTCRECTGRGLNKDLDCYKTCSKYKECEDCKPTEEKPKSILTHMMNLREREPKIKYICEGCKENVLFLGSDGLCEKCDTQMTKALVDPKCKNCGTTKNVKDGSCDNCFISDRWDAGTSKDPIPPPKGSFLEQALKDADRDKEIFKTTPPHKGRRINVSMTPTPDKSRKPSFMSPFKPKRGNKQFPGWCSVCCNIYTMPHNHTVCPANCSPGKALTAPVIDEEFDEFDVDIPSPSKYFKTNVTQTMTVSTTTTKAELPKLPETGGPCKEFKGTDKKSKSKGKCECGFYKEEHNARDFKEMELDMPESEEDKGGEGYNMPMCSNTSTHLHGLIKFTPSADEKEVGCKDCGSGKEYPKCRCVRMAADENNEKKKPKKVTTELEKLDRNFWRKPVGPRTKNVKRAKVKVTGKPKEVKGTPKSEKPERKKRKAKKADWARPKKRIVKKQVSDE